MDPRASQVEALLKPFNPLQSDLPSSRSPQCRPLSFEPPVAAVAPLDGLDLPQASLPLILHCTICLRTSTWYNPMHQNFEQHPPFDALPSLSISSHSTSSEPSSIGTEFFSSIVMSPSTDSPYDERVSAQLEDPLVASDSPDDNTPVALSHKSVVSHRQASSRIKSWIGGGLDGVCSSCHSLSPAGAPRAATNATLPRPELNDSKMAGLEHDSEKSNPLLASSHVPPFRRNIGYNSSANRSHPQAVDFPTDSQPIRATLQYPSGGIASSLPKHPSVTSNKSVKLGAKSPLLAESDVSSSRPNGVKSATPSSTSLSSIHCPERAPRPHDPQVLPNLPLKTNPPEAELTQRSPIIRTRKKSPPIVVQDFITTNMSTGSTIKREGISPDLSDCPRPEGNHRGTTLRALLREAKIPQPDPDDLINSSRRYPTTVDKWQAAMIATPRDHLRHSDFPTWQPYGATDSPFYHHLCALSASTSSLSGKDTLFSASVTSFRDSPCAESRPCSPVSETLMPTESALLSRRPSRGRPATSETLVNHTSELSATLSDTVRYLPADSPNESQEILSGSALAKPRHTPSNVSLIARLTNIHPSANKADRGFKRRPNTATGTTQSSSIAQSSPKPGHGRSTPSPNTAGPSSLLPSLFLTGSKATSAASRVTNVNTHKRPATATCSGTRSELASSLSRDSAITRPPLIQKPTTGKNPSPYLPTLPTIQGRVNRNDTSDLPDEPPKSSATLRELDIRPYKTMSSGSTASTKLSPVSASLQSSTHPRHASPVQLSQSVPNFLLKTRFPTPKRNAFYATTTLAVTTNQLTDPDRKHPNLEVSPWLQPEDFQSKSRNFILSVLPRPTASTFSPGQQLSVHLKLSNKAKARKYTAIYLLLIGNTTSDNAPQTTSHDFLRHNYLIYPNASEEVKIISNPGDLTEWHLEINLPEYANCTCTPGPLPLPSTGTHTAAKVSYSLQLHADRKQLLSTQESMNVNLNVITRAEARFQVTTQLLRTLARKGRIPFAGGYLGSIDELSLSHQVYYQSADRLRIGYQFELQLSSNSFLPASVAEELSKATSIQVHTLMRLHPKESTLKFVDHRSKIAIIPPDEKDGCVKWIIKGFLELKAVSQQMKAVKATLESSTPRTPRRPEHTMSARGMLSSSHGPNSLGSGLTSPLGSSTNHSLQQETERQAKFNNSQLFLMANIEQCPRVLTKPVEISSLIGSELLSPCSLRKIGDEMMKKAVMAEKMKKVQEENFKNDQ